MDPRSYQTPYGYHLDYFYVDSGGTDTMYAPSAPSMSRGPSIESKHSATYIDELSPVTPILVTGSMDYYPTPHDGFNVYGTPPASKGDGADASRAWYSNGTPVPQSDVTIYQPPDWSMAYTTAPLVPGRMAMPFGSDAPRIVPDADTLEAPAEANAPYACHHGGCDSKPFKRKADRDRHINHVHRADEDKDKFYCDYPKCQRSGDAFHRIDHCRDHYRDFHLEDLARRKGESDDWYQQRKNVPRSWWRCTRCLGRIRVEKYNFECPRCRVPCDKKRQRLRDH